jgi:hypothetical protein
MNLNRELREESRGGTSGRRAQQVRRLLAMAQVAIALVLLIGAGLLLASFRAVREDGLRLQPDERDDRECEPAGRNTRSRRNVERSSIARWNGCGESRRHARRAPRRRFRSAERSTTT